MDAILYTDISRDGMLTGCNVEATAELASQLSIPVIASGVSVIWTTSASCLPLRTTA